MYLLHMKREISEAEIEATFKAIKKQIDGNIIKIYEDGGVKIIDGVGRIRVFDTSYEFMAFAKQYMPA
jgi:hypothetical protein